MDHKLLQSVKLDAITCGTINDRQATSPALMLVHLDSKNHDTGRGVVARLVDGIEGLRAVGLTHAVVIADSQEVAKVMKTKADPTQYTMLSGHGRHIGLTYLEKTECMAVVVSGFKTRDEVLAVCHQPNIVASYSLSDIAKLVKTWMGSVDAETAGARVQSICKQAKPWSAMEAEQATWLVTHAPDNVWGRIDRGQWSINQAHTIVMLAQDISDAQVAVAVEKFSLKADDDSTLEEKVQDKVYSFCTQKSNRKGLTKSKKDRDKIMAAFLGDSNKKYTYQADVGSLTVEERKHFKTHLANVSELSSEQMEAYAKLFARDEKGELTAVAKTFRSYTISMRMAKELGHDMKHFNPAIK
jgi:hypothetical protein